MTRPLCSAWRTSPSPKRRWPEATDYINRARTAAPNDPAPGLALVRVYELQQDWANAKAVAGALSAQFPSDVNVLEAQARAQLGAGDTNGAIASYKRAYELAPEFDTAPVALSRLAHLCGRLPRGERRPQGRDRSRSQERALKADLVRVTAQLDGVDAAVSQANLYAKDDPNNNALSCRRRARFTRMRDAGTTPQRCSKRRWRRDRPTTR